MAVGVSEAVGVVIRHLLEQCANLPTNEHDEDTLQKRHNNLDVKFYTYLLLPFVTRGTCRGISHD